MNFQSSTVVHKKNFTVVICTSHYLELFSNTEICCNIEKLSKILITFTIKKIL